MSTCAKQYSKNDEQKLCERMAMAGVDFFTSFHHSFKRAKIISGTEDFYAIPDLSKKDQRFYTFYPSFQCRAETLASGAYCTTSEQDFDRGISNWHCQKSVDPVGARPSCWWARSLPRASRKAMPRSTSGWPSPRRRSRRRASTSP